MIAAATDLVATTAVAAIGALIAGISAIIKTWYLNRNERSRASRHLELAAQRTEFLTKWLSASSALEADTASSDEARVKARLELDRAYDHAGIGAPFPVDEPGRAIAQLRSLFLLESGLRRPSKLVVGLFYISLLLAASIASLEYRTLCVISLPEARGPDGREIQSAIVSECSNDLRPALDYGAGWWGSALLFVVLAIALRLFFGWWLGKTEGPDHKSADRFAWVLFPPAFLLALGYLVLAATTVAGRVLVVLAAAAFLGTRLRIRVKRSLERTTAAADQPGERD